ncbi:hypothetical protein, partial [Mesorhizobium sp. M7A.F.Ca.CA.001.13.1.1]|uniref:hypothetical protein n=1 Tax=Mesorhizobium sp. M7A.F.Ca.CA.001.13.1.1 TaxID=2496728 RepID=UPI0019D02911
MVDELAPFLSPVDRGRGVERSSTEWGSTVRPSWMPPPHHANQPAMAQKKAYEVDGWLAKPDQRISIVLLYG